MVANQFILIVDDDANMRKTLEEILRVNNYQSVGVGSGKEAVRLVGKEIFQAALIDLRLTDLPGLDILKAIKEKSPETECIILTGFASTETAIQAVNLGAYSYIQKPYDIDQLLLTINHALEKKETQLALSDAEDRYRQLYEGAFDGIVTVDLEGRIIDFNPAFLKILSYTPDELKSLRFQEITPERFHSEEQTKLDQILERGYSDLYEKEYIDKDGTLVPIELSGYLTRDPKWQSGRDVGFCA